jgi:hypothetical protein
MAIGSPGLNDKEVILDLDPHIETGIPPLPEMVRQIKAILDQHPQAKPHIYRWLSMHPREQMNRV